MYMRKRPSYLLGHLLIPLLVRIEWFARSLEVHEIKNDTRRNFRIEKVLEHLDHLFEEYEVVFLGEFGSRAKGYSTEHSDYDIKGFFVSGNFEKHFFDDILGETCEVIKFQKIIEDVEMDVELWNLKKALSLLLQKHNPTIAQWLLSPIVYRQNENLMKLKNFLLNNINFAHFAYLHHGTAKNNFYRLLNAECKKNKQALTVWFSLLSGFHALEFKGNPPYNIYDLLENDELMGASGAPKLKILDLIENRGEFNLSTSDLNDMKNCLDILTETIFQAEQKKTCNGPIMRFTDEFRRIIVEIVNSETRN